MRARGIAEVYIGGAADEQSRIVASYATARQRALADSGAKRTAAWFTYYDLHGAMSHCLAAQSRGDDLVLVGHSWGSDTALKVAHQIEAPVRLLAGVDPVMRHGSLLMRVSRRPGNAATVVHVDARPKRLDRSDYVKMAGVIMGLGMAPAFRRADLTIRTGFNHWAFADMMKAPDAGGVSLSDRINRAAWRGDASRTG